MKYLRRFETESQYETAKVRFEYPNVSYAEDIDIVHYMEKPDYSKEYLTFEALEDGTFTLSIPSNINSTYMTSASYSVDYGETWTTTNVDSTAQTITTPTITQGNKVLWKGVGKTMGKSDTTNNYSIFSATGNFNVKGNIMSMLYGDNFLNQVAFPSGSTYSFNGMFYNNKKLKSAESLILPATTLAERCYCYMFNGCTALTTAPELPATTLAAGCYWDMFAGCSGLITPPILPATTLANNCYREMFKDCTSLTTAPELPATRVFNFCYRGMFQGCTSLITAPEIKFTTMGAETCMGMFRGCTSLTTAPELPATTLARNCYEGMFSGCTSLTTAPELPATTLASNCYSGMFSGTNVLPDCTNIYFTNQTVVASGGLHGLFRGTKVTYSDLNNILPKNGDSKPCLPVTTLTNNCYEYMFSGCKSLTTAPELPATTLAESCYYCMFEGCTSLTKAPSILPATTLASKCCDRMFEGCTSLTTAPVLPATTLADYCYRQMFYGCTSLTTAPVLPATTLAEGCYNFMFNGCTNLNYIKAMFTTTPSASYTGNWVSGVASTGTFVKNSAATWNITGNNGVPTGWTVQTASE